MSKAEALTMLDDFAKNDKTPVFRNANRATVADEMRKRVDNPSLIDQGQSGTCGPASLVYDLLSRDPAIYVRAVQSLFDWGYAIIGKLQLKPGFYLLHGPMPDDVPQADWILLASIRDSENWFYEFSAKSKLDNSSAGTTMSELKDWFEETGYTKVESDQILTNWFDKTSNLNKSLKLYDDDYQVTWFICADMLTSSIPDSIKPDHVVVLAGKFVPPATKSVAVHIPIFTWGRKTTIPEVGGLTYGQFLDQYFGYVAGKF
jgi:hypothetical protein